MAMDLAASCRFRITLKQLARLSLRLNTAPPLRSSTCTGLRYLLRAPHPRIHMPAAIVRRTLSSDAPDVVSLKDTAMAFLNFDDHPSFDLDDQQQTHFLGSPEEPMLFDFDLNEPYPPRVPAYDYTGAMTDEDVKPFFTVPDTMSNASLRVAAMYSPDSFHGSDLYHEEQTPYPLTTTSNININNNSNKMDNWFTARDAFDMDTSPLSSPSSPIPIPSGPQSPSFFAFPGDHHPAFSPSHEASSGAASSFSPGASFSPSALAAALPLPHSLSASPPSSFEDHAHHLHFRGASAGSGAGVLSVSPHDTQTQAATPAWAAQLWDSPPSAPRQHLRTPSSPRSVASHALRHSPLAPRERRDSSSLASGLGLSSEYLFPGTSSSAPSGGNMNTIRAYSQRAESFSTPDDRDATVRRARRSLRGASVVDDAVGEASSSAPLKSVLRPPKLAPSAWQLYFTDWIQRQQASSSRKLNVAQAAKEAGAEYASLTEEEKEPYKRRSQAAKDVRERLHSDYMRTLTPEDIKRENAFRAAQRKAGKSRKSNIKDPNAPKKPLSAYFMFLQRIRSSPQLVKEVFGEEAETTKQSVLAAARWRAMSDEERKPFLAQAEQEKMEYEEKRRVYEDAHNGGGGGQAYAASNFNFSILPGSPAFPAIKIESESESDRDGEA
ncbi:putative HMG1 protein, partial [Mycena sanguinolenta]